MGQFVQLTEPTDEVYWPAAQLVHAEVPEADANMPVTQLTHAVEATEPVTLVAVPDGQAIQLEAPAADAY